MDETTKNSTIDVENDGELANTIDALFKRAQTIVGNMGEGRGVSAGSGSVDAATMKSINQRDLEMLRVMTDLGQNNKDAYERIEKKLTSMAASLEEMAEVDDDEEVIMGLIGIKGKVEALETKISELEEKQEADKQEIIEKMGKVFGLVKSQNLLLIITLILAFLGFGVSVAGLLF